MNADYYLTAELKPELPVVSKNRKLAGLGNKATTETNNMKKEMKYNVIVYNAAGDYVAEKEYTRGQESLSSNFLLDVERLIPLLSIRSTVVQSHYQKLVL